MNTKTCLLGIALMCALPSSGQTLKEWDNVSINSLNRLRSHTLEIPVADAEAAANAYTPTNALEASPYFLSLNGTWKFKWAGTPEQANKTFYQDGFNASSWDNIEVPSAWQMYGLRNGKSWDKPLYTNIVYPFSYDNSTWSVMADRPGWYTYTGSKKNPVGSYRREFTLPASWTGRDVILRLNGAGHGYYVWVNGQFVGYAEDSYLPSEFNVTDKVREGVNNISVRVYRFTSGSFLEDQDYWRLTGITRDIYLWSAPKTSIRDFFFTTTALRADNTEAAAKLSVNVVGDKTAATTLEARICDGTNVLASQSVAITNTDSYDLVFQSVSGIKAWSAELPQLYDLIITLKNNSQTVDTRVLKVGFRTVSVRKDGALLVNGNRVIFHGVDRHDFSEMGGRTVTKEEMENDLLQMKRLNVNGIRTSHYPNNPYLYDLCDRLGLYVLAEANVECHGNTELSHVETFRPAMVERSVRHVLTFRNHASIIIWSGGNESGNGDNFRTVMDSIGKLDPTRLTHYEGNSEWSSVTSTMYGALGSMESIGKDRLRDYQNGKSGIRPHVQCENTHAMGNSMGNQREFFDIYETYPAMAGEFVWDWKDQGIRMTSGTQPLTFDIKGRLQKTDIVSTLDPSKGEYWAYGGDYGDVPNDGNFCCNGVVLADCSPTAKSYNMKKIYQPIDFIMKDSLQGQFTLKSKMQQRTLDDLNVSYQILEDGIEISRGNIDNVAIGVGKTMDVVLTDVKNIIANPSHPKAEYFIRFSAVQKQATEWAEAGFEVASEAFRIRKATDRLPYSASVESELTLTQTNTAVTVKGDNFSVSFRNGELASYTYNSKSLLTSPLTLNAFRVPIDNEGSREATYDDMGLRDLTLTAGSWAASKSEDGKTVSVTNTNTYKSTSGTKFTVQQSFTVMADGAILVNALIDPSSKGMELPRLGMRTELVKGMEQMRWLGRGPWDSYLDRKEGSLVGLYHSTVSEQWTNFVKPQENGNKEEVRWMAISNSDGLGMMFVAPELMSTTVGHWRSEDIYTNRNSRKKHPNEVTFCQPTVVNLDVYQRALGNASCGPDVLEKYKVRAQKVDFTFLMLPLAEAQTDEQLAEKARVASPLSPMVNISTEKGIVTLRTSDPDATIHYSIDGGEERIYTAPFNLSEGGQVSAYSTVEGRMPSPVNTEQIEIYVSKSKWKVLSVSSEQGGSEAASNAIDEKPNTIWHTQYNPQTPTCPHEIVIDMSTYYRIAKFVYQGRVDMRNGRVANYEFYVSSSSTVWGAPVASGTLLDNSEPQQIDLPSRPEGRYLRLIISSTHDNQGFASVAEIGIIPEEAISKTETPTAAITTAANSYYYLRHKESGLFLHLLEGSGEGIFALGEVTENNLDDYSYRFQFTKVNKYTAYYNVKTRQPKRYMTVSGWNVNGSSTLTSGNHDQWILVEQLPERTVRLRVASHGMEYFNFDRHTAGSHIYSNKSTPAEFEAILQTKINDVVPVNDIQADANEPSNNETYNLAGRRAAHNENGILISTDGHHSSKVAKKQ